jgi:putative FmdB family regulatory protein
MPTYEYACRNCGSHLEVVQSFSDDPLTECPHCEGSLKKVFGSIGITFKGSGFYKTDSRSGASASRSSGDGAKEPSGDGATETKKETKAEPAAAGSGSGTASGSSGAASSGSGAGSSGSSSGTAKSA